MNWSEIQERRQRYSAEQKIRESERQKIMAILTHRTADFDRIGKRVVLLQYALLPVGKRQKAKVLAKRLGVSQARVSQVISDIEQRLAETELLTPLEGVRKPVSM